MKAIRVFVPILFFILNAFSLFSQDEVFHFKGKNGRIFVNQNNIPGLIYIDEEGSICLHSGFNKARINPLVQTTVRSGPAFSLSTAVDWQGQTWIIWQTRQERHSQIFAARLTSEGFKDRYVVSKNLPGKNMFPCLTVTLDSTPWAAWINIHGKKHQLKVKNLLTESIWTLDQSLDHSLFSPQLLVDGSGRLWAFWVGKQAGLDEIVSSFYNGHVWSEPFSVSADPDVPSFNPSVEIGPNGYPWVVWSGYDGEDYEIYLRSWDGQEWIPKEKITQNRHLSDGEPTLAFFQHSYPVIAWSQITGDHKEILITYKDGGKWHRENIPKKHGRNNRPRLFSTINKMLLSWEKEGYIFFTSFVPGTKDILEYNQEDIIHQIQPPSHLHQDEFIAFGDSITYGWDNGDAKERGYPPRLLKLLPDTFVTPFVYNRGVPAEATWEAVGRVFNVITTDLALYLLLMEGTNDVSNGSYSLDATAFNLREMAKKCSNFGVIPLISTIIPRARSRWTPTAKERTYLLNKKIRILASDLPIILVENFQNFYDYPASSGGYESLISTDNLHPNDKGYQFMAETWYAKIKQIPFPPVEITAKSIAGGAETVLTWEDDPRVSNDTGIEFYQIYRRTKDIDEFSHTGTAEAPTHSYKDTNLIPGESYVYTLASVNSDGVVGALAEPVFPESADPFPPVNIQAKILMREQSIHLSWEKNPQNSSNIKVKNYKIYRKTQGHTTFTLIKTTAAAIFEYIDEDISLDEDYIYAMSTVSSNGFESDMSSPVIPVIGDPYPPVSLTAKLYRRNKTIVLDWKNNPKNTGLMDIVYYRIYRKKSGESEFKAIKTILYPDDNYSDNDIDPEANYIYAVSAFNSKDLEGPLSDPTIPVISDPYPPENITVDTLVNKAFLYEEYINRITWANSPSNRNLFTITNYRIYRKQKGDPDELFQLIKEVDVSYLILLDRNLQSYQNAQSYEYGISAVDWDNIEGPIGKQL